MNSRGKPVGGGGGKDSWAESAERKGRGFRRNHIVSPILSKPEEDRSLSWGARRWKTTPRNRGVGRGRHTAGDAENRDQNTDREGGT